MTGYRLLYADLLTNTLHGELPVESISYSDVLNAPGAIRATLPLRPHRPDAVATLTEATLAPGRTALYVERDGVVLWGGILWTLDLDVDANAAVLAGEGFHSYFRRRYVRATLAFAGTDQAHIAKTLVDYAQAVPGGNLGIDTSGITAHGVPRDRTYPAYERANVGEALEQLAAVQGGFDFRYPCDWTGGGISRRLVLSHPATGRRTEHVFALGANVELLSLAIDATTLAFQVDAIGQGEGDDQLLRTAADPSALGTYPLLDDVLSHTDVSVEATLDAHAARRLARGRTPLRLPSLRAHSRTVPALGSYVVGDVVHVAGSHGLLTVDGDYRITTVAVDVDDTGAEAITLTLATLDVFT